MRWRSADRTGSIRRSARAAHRSHQLRRDDLAAPARPGDGRRAALPGDHHSCRPSLSSPLSAAILARFRDSCPAMSQRLSRFRRTAAAGAVLAASLAPAWDAQADPAQPDPPAAADQERADKETELRGVEDTLRASEEQRRAIEAEIESVRADRARLSAALIETTAKVQDAERGAAAAERQAGEPQRHRRRAVAFARAPAGGDRRRACRASADGQQSSARHSRQAQRHVGSGAGGDGHGRADTGIEVARPRPSRNDLDALARPGTRSRASATSSPSGARRWRSTKCVSPPSSTRASSRSPRRRTRSARSGSALPTSPGRRRRSRISSPGWTAKTTPARPRPRRAHATEAAAAAEIEAKARAARGSDPGRLKPEIAFGDARGQVPLPAAGSILKTFGSPDGLGGTERGLSIGDARRRDRLGPGRRGGAFRRTLSKLWTTLDHRRRRRILCASRRHGSNQCCVRRVRPRGRTDRRHGRRLRPHGDRGRCWRGAPVLYIELRKDGTAIDPGPWWAKADIEKARG